MLSAADLVRLEDNLQLQEQALTESREALTELKKRINVAKDGAGEAEAGIIRAENRIHEALIGIADSRAILKRCREGLPEGAQKAGKAD